MPRRALLPDSRKTSLPSRESKRDACAAWRSPRQLVEHLRVAIRILAAHSAEPNRGSDDPLPTRFAKPSSSRDGQAKMVNALRV